MRVILFGKVASSPFKIDRRFPKKPALSKEPESCGQVSLNKK